MNILNYLKKQKELKKKKNCKHWCKYCEYKYSCDYYLKKELLKLADKSDVWLRQLCQSIGRENKAHQNNTKGNL